MNTNVDLDALEQEMGDRLEGATGTMKASATTNIGGKDGDDDEDEDEEYGDSEDAAMFRPMSGASEVYGPGVESFWQPHHRRRKPNPKTRTSKSNARNLPPHLATPLSEAHVHYAQKEYDATIALLTQVVTQSPRLSEAFQLYGMICEDTRHDVLALQHYILAVKYSQTKSIDLLKKIAWMSFQLKQYDQSSSYAVRVCRIRDDADMWALRAQIKILVGDIRVAESILKTYIEKFPRRFSFLVTYSDLCDLYGFREHALNGFLKYFAMVIANEETNNNNNNNNSEEGNTNGSSSSHKNNNSNHSDSNKDLQTSAGGGSEMDGDGEGDDDNNNDSDDGLVGGNALEDDKMVRLFYVCRRAIELLLDQTRKQAPENLTRAQALLQQCYDCNNKQMQPRVVPVDLRLLEALCLLRQEAVTLSPQPPPTTTTSSTSSSSSPAASAISLLRPLLHYLSKPIRSYSSNNNSLDDINQTHSTDANSNDDNDDGVDVDEDVVELEIFFGRQLLNVGDLLHGMGMATLAKKIAKTTESILNDLTTDVNKLSTLASTMHASERDDCIERWFQFRYHCVVLWKRLGLFFDAALDVVDDAWKCYRAALRLLGKGNDPEALLRFVELSPVEYAESVLSPHLLLLLHAIQGQLQTNFLEDIGHGNSGSTAPTSNTAPPTTTTLSFITGAASMEERGLNNSQSTSIALLPIPVPVVGESEEEEAMVVDDGLAVVVDRMDDVVGVTESENINIVGEGNGENNNNNNNKSNRKNESNNNNNNNNNNKSDKTDNRMISCWELRKQMNGYQAFDQGQILHEIRLTLEWGNVFLEKGNYASFLCFAYPLVHAWCKGVASLRSMFSTNSNSSSNNNSEQHRQQPSQKRLFGKAKQLKQYVFIKVLQDHWQQHHTSRTHTISWLDETQNMFSKLVCTLCCHLEASLDDCFPVDTIRVLSENVTKALQVLEQSKLAEEITQYVSYRLKLLSPPPAAARTKAKNVATTTSTTTAANTTTTMATTEGTSSSTSSPPSTALSSSLIPSSTMRVLFTKTAPPTQLQAKSSTSATNTKRKLALNKSKNILDGAGGSDNGHDEEGSDDEEEDEDNNNDDDDEEDDDDDNDDNVTSVKSFMKANQLTREEKMERRAHRKRQRFHNKIHHPSEADIAFSESAKSVSAQAYEDAIEYLQQPFSVPHANQLIRSILAPDFFETTTTPTSASVGRELRGVDSNALEKILVFTKNKSQQKSLFTELVSAHDVASRRKYADAFEVYLEVYKEFPEQPLVSLCLGVFLLFGTRHVSVNLKSHSLMKALSFMNQYRIWRLDASAQWQQHNSDQSQQQGYHHLHVSPEAIEQEIHYNFGRFYQEIKLNHVAVECYKNVLRIADENPFLTTTTSLVGASTFALTREAAFNLVLIFRQARSDALALHITNTYLKLD